MDEQLGSGLSNLWSCTSLDAGIDFLKKSDMSVVVKKEVGTSCLDDELRVSCRHYILRFMKFLDHHNYSKPIVAIEEADSLLQKLQELREVHNQRLKENQSFADTLRDAVSSASIENAGSEAPVPSNAAKPTAAPKPISTNHQPEPKPVPTKPTQPICALWRFGEPESVFRNQTAAKPIITNQQPEPTEPVTTYEPILEDGYDSITETETEHDPYLEEKDCETLGLVVRPIATAARNFSSQELCSSQDAQVWRSNFEPESVANQATSDDDSASFDVMVT